MPHGVLYVSTLHLLYPDTPLKSLVNCALEASSGMYDIPCTERSKYYVSETGKDVDERIREHIC